MLCGGDVVVVGAGGGGDNGGGGGDDDDSGGGDDMVLCLCICGSGGCWIAFMTVGGVECGKGARRR